MRRLIVAITTGLTIALVALSLHSLSTATGGDEGQTLPSLFTSPIDPPSTIAGTVFEDINGNGERDGGEPGIPGVTVKLDNSIQGSITTDPDGYYSFALSWSGTYTITAVAPTGYISTTPQSVAVEITESGQLVEVDFGYEGIGTIRGTVFDDRNINGSQDEGEPGISEVRITLLQEGSEISTTTTGGDGTYAFASVLLGVYTVRETDPPGGYLLDTTPDTQIVVLTTPGQEETVDFGDYGPARVTGIVFNDVDGDGVRDSGEKGIPGVTVDLLRDDTVEDSRTTDGNGVYFLPWDELGDYTVRQTNLDGYISISDDEVEISKDTPSEVEVVDFADQGIGTISGIVFDDENGNQELDTDETGIEGVTVTLVQDDTRVRTTTTANDGYYEFPALGLGDYGVQETDPDGYGSTTPNIVTTTLTLSTQATTVDFGDRGIGTIRGITFDDRDGSQEQDLGEPGISGVTITLLQEESTILTTTTAGGGMYEFDSVWLGEYTVQEADPEGYISTTPNTATVSLTMTNQIEVRHFGDRGIGTIAGTVFSDDNGNQIQDVGEQGIPAVSVNLLQDSSTIVTTTTAGDGSYTFESLFLGDYTVQETDLEGYASTTPNEVDASLTAAGEEKLVDFGDRGIGTIQGIVFDDEDGDSTQDVDEMGMDDVTVTLLSAGSVVSTTTTAGGGAYAFDPVWLDDYTVRETDPSGYTSTTPNEVTVTLTMTQQVEVVNFGDRGIGAIVGTVFSDDNGNEVQDGTEEGIEGVIIALLQDDVPISTTVTASDGSYAFASLLLGDYTVREANPMHYVSTTSDEVNIALDTPGEQRTVDFGDRGIGAIVGTVFFDDNGNEVQDGTEEGIEGVTITLLQDDVPISTTVTASDGSYAFVSLLLGDYTVRETNPAHYVSTTSDEVNIALDTPGQQKTVNFGDQGRFNMYLPIVARSSP